MHLNSQNTELRALLRCSGDSHVLTGKKNTIVRLSSNILVRKSRIVIDSRVREVRHNLQKVVFFRLCYLAIV